MLRPPATAAAALRRRSCSGVLLHSVRQPPTLLLLFVVALLLLLQWRGAGVTPTPYYSSSTSASTRTPTSTPIPIPIPTPLQQQQAPSHQFPGQAQRDPDFVLEDYDGWLEQGVGRTFVDRLDALIAAAPPLLQVEQIAAMEAVLRQFHFSTPRTLYVDGYAFPAHQKCAGCTAVAPVWISGEWDEFTDRPEARTADVNVNWRCFQKQTSGKLPMTQPHHALHHQACYCNEAQHSPYWAQFFSDYIQYCDTNITMYEPRTMAIGNARGYSMRSRWDLETVTKMASRILTPPTRKEPARKVLFMHRNCKSFSGREQVIRELQPYVHVHSLSRCLNNDDGSLDFDLKQSGAKMLLSETFHFVAAMENFVEETYITEKRYHAWFGRSIPIVWGTHDPESTLRLAPGANSVLFVEDYHEDWARLAADIRLLSEDETLYRSHFDFQSRGLRKAFVRELFMSPEYYPCRLCEHIDLLHTEGRFQQSNLFKYESRPASP